VFNYKYTGPKAKRPDYMDDYPPMTLMEEIKVLLGALTYLAAIFAPVIILVALIAASGAGK
jgi:hypothetical protein